MSGGLYSMDQKDFDQTLDLTRVKPYGDTMNDGKTQLSFTLPVPCGDEAVEAAPQSIATQPIFSSSRPDMWVVEEHHFKNPGLYQSSPSIPVSSSYVY